MKTLADSRKQAADSRKLKAESEFGRLQSPSPYGNPSFTAGPRTSDFGPRASNFGPRTSDFELTLVGAGPGDPELITLKGIRALQRADVVLYDALVDESLLDFAPADALKVFVGKRKGRKSWKQDDINQLIVDYVWAFGCVVRLKGGDPFVFGRGWEEMAFAAAHGIKASYVPGVSSAVAAPGAAGIAVTQRGASRGFWVLTATTDTGELNPEIHQAAATDATVVVLMGLSQLEHIADAYARMGKSETPMAVISNAGMPGERWVTGSAADIQKRAAAARLESPAVVVAGEVVRHRLPLFSSSKVFATL